MVAFGRWLLRQFLSLSRNLQGQEIFRYEGQWLARYLHAGLIEANFSRPDLPFHGLTFGQGDRMVEVFYTHRWYNVFQIHDRRDDHLKGWYCNIALPAELNADSISFVDLALDLLVYADGRQLVLDEDEFAALDLDADTQAAAWAALADLQYIFAAPGGFRVERDWMRLAAL